MSHRPLDQLRKETKAAHRSPHLRKKHIPGTDTIDSLDKSVFGTYHHGGPYDATLLARNTSYNSSPVAAVSGSNAEALKATPRENIKDSLDRHVPLSGTAVIPPGMAGLDGRVMEYEEGADLMREKDAPGGAYKRWADVVCYLIIPSFNPILTRNRITYPKTTKAKASPPSPSKKPSKATKKANPTAASHPKATMLSRCSPRPDLLLHANAALAATIWIYAELVRARI
jgi:hypothetical protein